MTACAISRDGKHYVVMTQKSVVVYETVSHKKVRTYYPKLARMEQLTAFALPPNFDSALLGTGQGNMLLLSLADGKVLWQGQRHERGITALVMSPNGSWALSGSSDMTITHWNCATGVCIATWRAHTWGIVTTLALSPDGGWALSGSRDRTIKRWDCATGVCVATWQGHSDWVTALTLSPEGGWALSGSDDKTIKRWDCATGACVATWQGHTDSVTAMVLSPEDGWALSASKDKTIKRWDCVTGKCVATWQGHTVGLAALALSPEGGWALSGSWGKTIKRWDCATSACLTTWRGHTNGVTALALSPEGGWTLSGSWNQKIHRWDCMTGECVATWQGHTSNVNALALSPKGDWALSGGGSWDYTIKRWDCETGACVATWQGHTGEVTALALSPGGGWALSGSNDKTIKRWDCQTGTCVATWLGHTEWVNALALSPKGDWALSVSSDYTIKRWDCETSTCVATWQGHRSWVNALALSPDGGWALSGSGNQTIKRWDCVTGKCVATWQGHTKAVLALALSPEGRWVVSSGPDGNVIIWQASNGKERARYSFTYVVNKLAWSLKDPSLILMGMWDGSISAWTFKESTVSLHLKWRNNQWGIHASNTEMLNVHGLPEHQQHLFVQKGAKVQLSAKSSEDEVLPNGDIKKGVLSHRNELILFKHGQRLTNLFDKSHILRPSVWVITLARQKSGKGEKHVFLILESIEKINNEDEDYYYRIRRMDFVLELRHEMLPEKASIPKKTDKFGQALIEVADKSFEDAKELVQQCYFKSSGITFKQGTDLLRNIFNDQEKNIGYSLPGAGNLYRMFRTPEAIKHHNCLSWCEEHLDAIEVSLTQKSWIDSFGNDPERKLGRDKSSIVNDNNNTDSYSTSQP